MTLTSSGLRALWDLFAPHNCHLQSIPKYLTYAVALALFFLGFVCLSSCSFSVAAAGIWELFL